ncbi:MAG: PadR family transcriptional regulator [Nitrososphaerota archaeon]|nr:PadR family transcriptional regulator [Nitrososphaerota archaeon]
MFDYDNYVVLDNVRLREYRIRYSYMYLIRNMPIAMRAHKDLGFGRFTKPQGAPRGLLLHYILYQIYKRPTHGYEIIQEIEARTEGAWRPGPGSIYPMLKKLVAEGLIKSECPSKTHAEHRIYQITPKGRAQVQKIKNVFRGAGQRWSLMSRIFVDMLEPEDLTKYFVEGTKNNFDVARECLDSKMALISESEAEYILKEYSLNLQHQLDWSNGILEQLKRKPVARPLPKIASK